MNRFEDIPNYFRPFFIFAICLMWVLTITFIHELGHYVISQNNKQQPVEICFLGWENEIKTYAWFSYYDNGNKDEKWDNYWSLNFTS